MINGSRHEPPALVMNGTCRYPGPLLIGFKEPNRIQLMAELAHSGTAAAPPKARLTTNRRADQNTKEAPTAATMTAFWYRTPVASASKKPATAAAFQEPFSMV